MKLNLGLIVNSLEFDKDLVCLDDSDAMRYIDAIPYLGGNSYIAPNILYLFKWDQLRTNTGNLDSVLCIGGGNDAIEFFKKHHYYGAIFAENTDLLELICSIRVIFNHYNKLELELMELLSQDVPTKKLLDKCADLFCAHVSLYDSNMGLIEYSDLFAPTDDPLWEKTRSTGESTTPMVPRDQTHMTPNIPGKYPHTSLVLSEGMQPHFNYGFDSGDARFATMVIYPTVMPLNQDQTWMVDHVGKLLLPKMNERFNYHINQRNRLRNTLRYLIHQNDADSILSSNDFTKFKWMPNDIYRLALIQMPPNTQNTSHYLYNYENIFAEYYSDCIAFYFDEQIVMVFHGEACDFKPETLAVLEKQLAMDNATCCMGLKFCDYRNIPTHYYFTVNGIRLFSPESRIQYFKSVIMQHLTAGINSVLPLKALCHYAATLVSRYDKENGTELLLTLETYLINNRSLIESANRLFVHKSTISYRLKCIEHIVPINYDDPDERFEILISCIVLRCFDEIKDSK